MTNPKMVDYYIDMLKPSSPDTFAALKAYIDEFKVEIQKSMASAPLCITTASQSYKNDLIVDNSQYEKLCEGNDLTEDEIMMKNCAYRLIKLILSITLYDMSNPFPLNFGDDNILDSVYFPFSPNTVRDIQTELSGNASGIRYRIIPKSLYSQDKHIPLFLLCNSNYKEHSDKWHLVIEDEIFDLSPMEMILHHVIPDKHEFCYKDLIMKYRIFKEDDPIPLLVDTLPEEEQYDYIMNELYEFKDDYSSIFGDSELTGIFQ